MMTAKDQLKRLIDELPETIAGEVFNFAEFLRRKEAGRAQEAALDAYADDDGANRDEAPAPDDASAMRIAWSTYQRECRGCLEDLRDQLEV
jgi:hypothetical protein